METERQLIRSRQGMQAQASVVYHAPGRRSGWAQAELLYWLIACFLVGVGVLAVFRGVTGRTP